MSYLGSRIAAPASHPQGHTLWQDLTLFSSVESRPPWRGLNPSPTELKMMTLLTEPRDLVGSTCQLEVFIFTYCCNPASTHFSVTDLSNIFCVSCISLHAYWTRSLLPIIESSILSQQYVIIHNYFIISYFYFYQNLTYNTSKSFFSMSSIILNC